MNTTRRRVLGAALGATALATLPAQAHAQAFPARPVNIVVPYPPGGSSEQLARSVQVRLSAALGQPVVIENRAGAGGTIGAAYVAKSPPDGYRILMATQPIITINPHLQKDMGFDPLKDLTPLTNGVNAVVCIAVSSSVPAQNLAELIAWGRKNPGALTFGTAGAGSPQHVGGMLLAQRAQMEMTHVPYKGGGPMLTDLMAGHIKAGVATMSVFRPFINDRRIKVLAIGEKARFPGAPDIPTIAETVPNFELSTWLGFYGPGGLPADITRTLSMELIKALKADDVRGKLADAGLLVAADGPEALGALGRSEHELYGRIIRDNRISAE
jgi:tripartite-type tricarboxylate transporter receptor subunit TctC